MKTQSENQEADRVRRHTSPKSLRAIDKQIEESIRFHAAHPTKLLNQRIEELEREWDMERWLGTNAASIALAGAVLGLTVNRKWLLLTCGRRGPPAAPCRVRSSCDPAGWRRALSRPFRGAAGCAPRSADAC